VYHSQNNMKPYQRIFNGFIPLHRYCLKIVCWLFISVSLTSLDAIAYADIEFDSWKARFRQEAIRQGILPAVFARSIEPLVFDPDIIKLDSNQPEFTRHIWTYFDNAISPKRLQKGKTLLQKYRQLFDKIEKQYGVQREILVAIWAMESDFGRNYGNKNVLRSLATLAYHGKRANFAQQELLNALHIIQDKKINPNRMIGSWAGAMGQPQFMPSSFLRYAVDYDRDGVIDLWNSVPDVLASIANFLAQSGWRRGESWGIEIKLPKPFDWRLNSAAYELRFIQWKQLGVSPANGKPYPNPNRLAHLLIPAGRFGPVFLVTHNFEIIKQYNKSTSYALAVAHLSQLLSNGEGFQIAWPRGNKALNREQIIDIQRQLQRAGHDPGGIDGKIGEKTREAIRTWQIENGLAGDGYANKALLEHLSRQKYLMKKTQ